MTPRNALSELLSSGVRAGFFTLLFGVDRPDLHLRDIARRSGFAIGTVQQEALKLVRLGLVVRRRDGNRVYFRAEQNHPLYSEIVGLVLKTTGVVGVLRTALSRADITHAFVFGSVAEGTSNTQSDIDLFVIGTTSLRQLSSVLRPASRVLGRELNPHVMSADEFARRVQRKEHFVHSVMQSPRLMIIGDERELTRMV